MVYRALMADFTDPHDRILGGDVTVLRATREPCPVCAHPTGDCAGATPAPAPQDTLGSNVFRSLDGRQTFVVKQNVYEEVTMTTGVIMRLLVVSAGSEITFKRARELGLL